MADDGSPTGRDKPARDQPARDQPARDQLAPDQLAREFEARRGHLRAVAYRLLGSLPDADDAVQETWLRLSRSGPDGIDNLGGWLTTVVARVSLTMLRTRRTRREQPVDDAFELPTGGADGVGPEDEAVLADSVGLALLVVLDTLTPAERLAFVLHDVFAVPFEEVGPIVGRSPAAARQLASRARRRVRGSAAPPADVARQRAVVDAFLAAARGGRMSDLLAVLDPDVVLRVDGAVTPDGVPQVVRGAAAVAGRANSYPARARHSAVALVDGSVGLVLAPGGRLALALRMRFVGERIVGIDLVADPDGLDRLVVAALDAARVSSPRN